MLLFLSMNLKPSNNIHLIIFVPIITPLLPHALSLVVEEFDIFSLSKFLTPPNSLLPFVQPPLHIFWLCPTKALWEHLLSGYRGWRIKVGCVNFLLAQANGWACIDFGCNHKIDELF
jgi:hypothetical protein